MNDVPMRPTGTAVDWLPWGDAISVSVACKLSGRSGETVRQWCKTYGIGIQVSKNACWRVSRPALRALLNGDAEAVQAIRAGDRRNPIAAEYYKRPLDEYRSRYGLEP